MQYIIYYGNIFYYTFNILITYYKYQYSIYIYTNLKNWISKKDVLLFKNGRSTCI